jgi:hypothetical protein
MVGNRYALISVWVRVYIPQTAWNMPIQETCSRAALDVQTATSNGFILSGKHCQLSGAPFPHRSIAATSSYRSRLERHPPQSCCASLHTPMHRFRLARSETASEVLATNSEENRGTTSTRGAPMPLPSLAVPTALLGLARGQDTEAYHTSEGGTSIADASNTRGALFRDKTYAQYRRSFTMTGGQWTDMATRERL